MKSERSDYLLTARASNNYDKMFHRCPHSAELFRRELLCSPPRISRRLSPFISACSVSSDLVANSRLQNMRPPSRSARAWLLDPVVRISGASVRALDAVRIRVAGRGLLHPQAAGCYYQRVNRQGSRILMDRQFESARKHRPRHQTHLVQRELFEGFNVSGGDPYAFVKDGITSGM